MRKFSDHGFVQLVLLLAAIPFCFCINSTASCVERDREALIKFQQSFQDTHDGFSSWKGKDCCKWKEVSCDDQSAGHVVKLDLRAKRLRTQVHFQATEVSLSCLLELKYLKYLDLSGNNLGDGPIPKFFGSMKQLTYLNLSSAQFSGTVPHHLGNLTSLQILDLSNQPWLIVDDLRWLSCLLSLHHLDMSDLYFEETLNLMQVLSMLPSLLCLRLSNCGLSETQFPGGGTNATFLLNLQSLDLANNELLGPIPDALRNMTSLRRLDLSFNILQSSIPSWLGNLENLVHLNLSHNVFNSIEGGLLSILRNACHLKSLDLSLNPFQGEILGTSGTLSGCTEYDLDTLRRISFSGPIPFSLGNLSTLRELYLSHNQLNGTVPESLGQLSNLTVLDLSSNNIDGIVSEVHFANLSKLEILNFALNHLTIKVKSNWEAPFQLKYVRMESCKFGTQFPQWLLTQKTITLDLSNASVSGTIPKSLHGLHLTYLDLSYNEITGSLPQKISDMMPRLDSLFLGSNHIKGSVPTSFCNIETLGALDLSKNRLSGEIPGCLKNLQTLYAVDLSSNNLSGVIPSSVGYLRHLVWLNLNNNSLHGELPLALRNCSHLKHLDLGNNRLSGHIPVWIRDSFEFLIILRLQRNTFNGSIPSQLCQLSQLQLVQYSTNQPESDQQGSDIDAEPTTRISGGL
ncbi:putative leucine-rich repeat receptor-like protein kinase [Prunus yedoensis var. nudiflora]|uniref:Putative leucine-rich repeat receptor-like protein kinase n=1 Tax=Prunus yedoensis var. nudiflora TaxID=2094558 RepID=A0A314V5B4_PRUYE|nr:putative leucine-rich repeat receptor-like protein kinase [Prunus yedoensis var. nudiflora]